MEHLEQAFMHLRAAFSAATFCLSVPESSSGSAVVNGCGEAATDEATDSNLKRCLCNLVVIPSSPSKSRWDVFILLLIVYSAVTVPVRVCFSAEATTWSLIWWFEVVMSLSFMCDLFLSFCTAYHSEGTWITSHSEIAKRYLMGWFWIDAPSSIPVELIQLVVTSSDQVTLLRLLRLLRLIRLMRLLKIGQYVDSIEESYDINLRVLRLVGVVAKVLFVSHLLGCFWFYVGSAEPEDEGSGTAEQSWLSVYDDGSALSAPVDRQYLYSVYWALTTLTTVGYGDITAQNDSERAYTMFALLVSAIIFAYLMGDVGALIASLDRQKAMIDDRMDSVKEYVTWRRMPNDLRIRVRRYYAHYFAEQPGFDERDILEGLSHALRAEVTRDILKDTLGKLRLFTHRLPPDFQAAIYPKLKPLVVEGDGEVIFERGSFAHDLAFLVDGEVGVMTYNSDSRQRRLTPTHSIILDRKTGEDLISILSEGCFGQTVLMGRRREATYVVHGPSCKLMMISKEDLEQLVEDEPQHAKKMCAAVLKDFEKNELISSLSQRWRINDASGAERAATILQRHWRATVDRLMAQHDTLFQAIKLARQTDASSDAVPKRVSRSSSNAMGTFKRQPSTVSRQTSPSTISRQTSAISLRDQQSFISRARSPSPEPDMGVTSRAGSSSSVSTALKSIMPAIEALQTSSERSESSVQLSLWHFASFSGKMDGRVATLEHQITDLRGMVQQVLERLAETNGAQRAELRQPKGGSSFELLAEVRGKLSSARKGGASPPHPRSTSPPAYSA